MPKLADYDEEVDKYFILMEEILLVLHHVGVLTMVNPELPTFL
jgi:hypothetical protein